MSAEQNKSLCTLCDSSTETFVRVSEARDGNPNHRFFERKIPLCEQCFKGIQPTKANKQRVFFWSVIFPVIEEEPIP
jgi:hypothetical protein